MSVNSHEIIEGAENQKGSVQNAPPPLESPRGWVPGWLPRATNFSRHNFGCMHLNNSKCTQLSRWQKPRNPGSPTLRETTWSSWKIKKPMRRQWGTDKKIFQWTKKDMFLKYRGFQGSETILSTLSADACHYILLKPIGCATVIRALTSTKDFGW